MIEGILNWLTSVPATIWGSLIAGILTLLGVVVGQFSIYWREEEKKNQELDALRDAIAVELQTMDDTLEGLLYAAHDMEIAKENAYALTDEQYEETFKSDLQAQITFILTRVEEVPDGIEVYESNADKIGKLDTSEAEGVIHTHRALRSLYQRLQQFGSAINHDDLVLNDEINWKTGGGLDQEVLTEKAMIETQIVNVVVGQKMTRARLGYAPSDHDRALIAYALSRDSPKSKEHDRTQEFLDEYIEESDFSFENLPSDAGFPSTSE